MKDGFPKCNPFLHSEEREDDERPMQAGERQADAREEDERWAEARDFDERQAEARGVGRRQAEAREADNRRAEVRGRVDEGPVHARQKERQVANGDDCEGKAG